MRSTFGIFSSTQNFTIGVNNVAPSTPVDSNAAANTVLEGAANGTSVGITASAFDINGPGVTYSMAGDSRWRLHHQCDNRRGHRAGWHEDRLRKLGGTRLPITVQVSDGTTPNYQLFTINVGDVALATPVDSNAATNTVAEGAAVGTTVGITASAVDSSGPATTYSLIGDTSAGGFTINASTGVVTVANSSKIDFESSGAGHSYNITVQATNGMQTSPRHSPSASPMWRPRRRRQQRCGQHRR